MEEKIMIKIMERKTKKKKKKMRDWFVPFLNSKTEKNEPHTLWVSSRLWWLYVTVHRKRDQLGQIMIVQYERF